MAGAILVVDDDPVVRDLMTAVLESDGLEVVACADGADALAVLGERSISVVLLDRTMPGVGGLDVLRTIRADPRLTTMPVIIVTGMDDTRDRVEGLDVGADDYVVKPFDPEEVVARVRAQLRRRETWIERVSASVEGRGAAIRAAGLRAAQAEGLHGIAAALCTSFVTAPGVDGVALVEVGAADGAPLAAAGHDPMLVIEHHGRRRDLAALTSGQRSDLSMELGGRIIAVVPVSIRGRALGMLAVCGDTGAVAAEMLAAALDFAALTAGILAEGLERSASRLDAQTRFRSMLDHGSFSPVFQPVVTLESGLTVGYEALTRFDDGIDAEKTFVDAARLGAGLELEAATLALSMAAGAHLPDEMWLAVNVSPSLILERRQLTGLLTSTVPRQVVLEISELEPVNDYDALHDALSGLVVDPQISVDDAGSGFASLAHILALGAHFVKLDKSWVDGIDVDPAKRALVSGLQGFARETDAHLIAEGVETEAQLETLMRLGITYGQGYLLGRPEPLAMSAP